MAAGVARLELKKGGKQNRLEPAHVGCHIRVIVTWPTNATGFTLKTATTLAAPVWITGPRNLSGLGNLLVG